MSIAALRTALCLCAATMLLSTGCISYHTNTKGRPVRENAVQAVTASQPIALKNDAPAAGDQQIGRWIGWKVYGDLHKFTGSAIETLKMELDRQKVAVSDTGAKSLALAVCSARAQQGAFKFRVTVSLKVKTGGGLEKTYEGRQNYMNGYATTSAVEFSLAHCVEQMLSDPEILAYLKQ